MKLTLRDLAEIVGIVTIVASLVFVGLELQQSREIAVADVYQQQANLLVEIHNNQMATAPYMSAVEKLRSGKELDSTDLTYLRAAIAPWLSYYENVHFQYMQGLLSEEHWQSVRSDLSDQLHQEIWRDEWLKFRQTYRDSFRSEVDAMLESHGNESP